MNAETEIGDIAQNGTEREPVFFSSFELIERGKISQIN